MVSTTNPHIRGGGGLYATRTNVTEPHQGYLRGGGTYPHDNQLEGTGHCAQNQPQQSIRTGIPRQRPAWAPPIPSEIATGPKQWRQPMAMHQHQDPTHRGSTTHDPYQIHRLAKTIERAIATQERLFIRGGQQETNEQDMLEGKERGQF